MKTQENQLRKTLINIERYCGVIHNISQALLSLQHATAQSKFEAFHDKELHEKTLQLIMFFNNKYTDIPTFNTKAKKVSEIPTFTRNN
jgi:hypothetical protein